MTDVSIQAAIAATLALSFSAAFAQQAATGGASQTSSSGAANAASTDSQLTEIVVTAQRRAQKLQDVPLSISVFGAEQLQQQSINTEADLQRSVPGLTIRETSNANQFNYSIRGQSIDAFSGSRPAVVPYVNDVQLNDSSQGSFYDLESVQVLKGPQGTLFGRNATGGAVLYTTAKPQNEFSGYVTARFGNYGLYEGKGAVNLPIVDNKLLVRLAFDAKDQEGYIRNEFNGARLGGGNTESGRASIIFRPVDWIENFTTLQYTSVREQNTGAELYSAYPCGASNNGIPLKTMISCLYSPALDGIFGVPGAWNAFLAAHPGVPAGGLVAFLQQQKAAGIYNVNFDQSAFFRADGRFFSNATTIDVGPGLTFKNIVGYGLSTADTGQDDDGSPYPITIDRAKLITHDGLTYTFRDYSEEPQLLGKAFDNKLDYIVGGYYSNDTSKSYQALVAVDLTPILEPADNSYIYRLTDRSTAIYAQGTYDLSSLLGIEKVSFTGGYRRTWEVNGIEQLPGSVFYPTIGAFPERNSVNKPSWQVGVNYQPNRDLLLYVVSRGSWRSGGFNGGAPPVNALATQGGNLFAPETTKDVEVGMKFDGQLLDRPMQVNLAAYNQWVYNVQRAIYVLLNGNIASVTGSVPEARIRGFEAQTDVALTHWLNTGFALSYVQARYTSPTTALLGQSFTFGPYADTPAWSGSVFGQVRLPLANDLGDLSLRADYYAQTNDYFSNLNDTSSPGTQLPGYGILNLRLDWNKIAGSGLSASAFATNVTDKEYFSGGLPLGAAFGLNAAVPGRPRMYGAELTYKF